MSGAREEILGRVARALGDVSDAERPDQVPVQRAYRRRSEDTAEAVLDRFAARVRDYRADLVRVAEDTVGEAVTEACRRLGLRRLVVPSALPEAWRPQVGEVIEDPGLSPQELDEVDGAVTGCAAAIAETGTIALDGRGASGRRSITLVPDHHICIVRAEQVVASVPEGVGVLAEAVRVRAPVTLIAGPSASSDIELSRVEGVHGPRNLLVLLVDSVDIGSAR